MENPTTHDNRATKLIRIDKDVKKTLAHQAVSKGVSLNAYIEHLLREAAEAEEERGLLMLMDEGDQEVLSDVEAVEFERYLKSLMKNESRHNQAV
jgi:hypothetical protein